MFPTPYTVTQIPCTGLGVDAMGSDTPIYGDPITRRVYGWSASDKQEAQHGHTERDNNNIDLAMPYTTVNLLDKFVVAGKPYICNGIRDRNHGFHGWRPGIVVQLNAVTG